MSCPRCNGTGFRPVRFAHNVLRVPCDFCNNAPWTPSQDQKRIRPLPTDLQGYRCTVTTCPQRDTAHFHVKV